MPLFSPPRYQAPFRPPRPQDITGSERFIGWLEQSTKGPLFGCRMCGNCILQETAFVCPMTCPKGLRNGLCGGATPEACEVDPSRPCTWYVIYERAERLGRMEQLLEINAPLDGNRVGRETWLEVLRAWRRQQDRPRLRELLTDRESFRHKWDILFRSVRQPDWWQGDAAYHPPAYEQPASDLEAALVAGQFVLTTEITPPLSASSKSIEDKLAFLRPYVTAINFTDNASASARMSSLASSLHCLQAGVEPIFQVQARDRNRSAIEADVIGAASHGIRNILCLSGDHQTLGVSPQPVPHQFDLDSIQVLWMLRRMRDEGVYLDGRTLKEPPHYFLGAAASPFLVPAPFEAIRTEKKINAGAQFLETQPVFDIGRFSDWLEALDKRNLLGKVHILAGLVPLRSARAAHYMAEKVPGVAIPQAILQKMDAAGDDKKAQQEAGFEIALGLLQQLKALPGLSGVHIMAVFWEEVVPELVVAAGLGRQ